MTSRRAYALVSDAGTPLISDPGFVLVRSARTAGVAVMPVPGASACTAALSASGLPTDRFAFEGFLPAQSGARARRLEALAAEPRTLVLFEAPHRLETTLAALRDACGGSRPAVVLRELTKRYESVYSGTLEELCRQIGADPDGARGEIVIVVGGATVEPAQAEIERTLRILLAAVDRKTALRIAAELTGRGRNELYALALELKSDAEGD